MQISGCQSLSFKGFDFLSKSKQTAAKKQETQEHKFLPAIDIPDMPAYVFIPKKFQIRTIPDFIEFTPAKTIDEAKKFAKDNFLIDQYELTDIDCANYVNEALSAYYNKNNTALPVVRQVLVSPDEELGFSAMGYTGRILVICEKRFKKIDNYIEEFLNKYTVKERCQNADETCDLTESQKKYFKLYKENMAGAKNYTELSLKEKVGFLFFLRGFSREVVPNNENGKMALPDGGVFWIVNHEIGHEEHYKNDPIKYIDLKVDFRKDTSSEEAKARFREMEPNWEATLKVSDYASTRPVEFVAEVFACLQNGVKFDDDVMELYEKYGGPKIA